MSERRDVVFVNRVSELDLLEKHYRQVCAQFFWRNGLKGNLPFVPEQIGGWWRANEEVDLVVLGGAHMMPVECKWSRHPVGKDILEQLERKSKALLKEANGQTVLFGLCSRSGFTDQIVEIAKSRNDVFLYDWKNMVDE